MPTGSSRDWRCWRQRWNSSRLLIASLLPPRWRLRSRAELRTSLLALLFIVDPLDELKAYKDSSVAMMREAAGRGHLIHAATPAELAASATSVTARAYRLRVSSDNAAWYEDLGAGGRPVAEFDAVLVRKDPPFDVEFLNATLLLSSAAARGARIVNDAQALRDHNEKLSILEFPQFTRWVVEKVVLTSTLEENQIWKLGGFVNPL